MKKRFSFLSLLLVTAIAFANPIDFDKAFKESAKIEKQIKKTSFPKQTYNITDFGAKPDNETEPCWWRHSCCPPRNLLYRPHYPEKQR